MTELKMAFKEDLLSLHGDLIYVCELLKRGHVQEAQNMLEGYKAQAKALIDKIVLETQEKDLIIII